MARQINEQMENFQDLEDEGSNAKCPDAANKENTTRVCNSKNRSQGNQVKTSIDNEVHDNLHLLSGQTEMGTKGKVRTLCRFISCINDQ